MCEVFNEINWDSLLSSDTIDVKWNLFKEKVTSVIGQKLLKELHLTNLHGDLAHLLKLSNKTAVIFYVQVYSFTL